VIKNAGQNFPGTDPRIPDPGHEGVIIKLSDHITFADTTITNSYGKPFLILGSPYCTMS
jgi:hypothetical protein